MIFHNILIAYNKTCSLFYVTLLKSPIKRKMKTKRRETCLAVKDKGEDRRLVTGHLASKI